MRLDTIAKVIRSKNAGPCLLTLDLMLPDEESFTYVAERAGALRRSNTYHMRRNYSGVTRPGAMTRTPGCSPP